MLDLLKSYTGSATSRIYHLALPQEISVLYCSADSIVILDARSLSLRRVLAFWEAFPGLLHSKGTVDCLSVDSGMGLVIAAMGHRVAAWSLSGVQKAIWRVHSSLILDDNNTIAALDSRSGLLAIGTQDALSVYTLILENDLPTWSNKWSFPTAAPSCIYFAPSLMYIATTSKDDNAVRIHNTTSGRITQTIVHPRPVIDVMWREPQVSSRDDLMLYTVTSDSTLRFFLPVLDQPHHLQLHAALDLFSALPLSVSSQCSSNPASSSVFRLDRKLLKDTYVHTGNMDEDAVGHRRIYEINEQGWDLFLRVLDDGALIVGAVADIDRRPPTLLKSFSLVRSAPGLLLPQPSQLFVLPTLEKNVHTLVTSPPLATFDLSLLPLFDNRPEGLKTRVRTLPPVFGEDSSIVSFVRTAEGHSVGVIREHGGEIWTVHQRGSQLRRAGSWSEADIVVVLESGKCFATYAKSTSVLTLHTSPSASLTIPIVVSLFSVPFDQQSSILGITEDYSIVQVYVTFPPLPSLTLVSVSRLPLSLPPLLIIPVDPMAWTGPYKCSETEHDVLLSVTGDGELAFWIPEEVSSATWKCTGKVRTGRRGIRKACCSSAKKSVLVVPTAEGEELTIWDSKESEFTSGFEFRQLFSSSEPINDLDWTATPDSQSILAVGFNHHVDILCQRRMTYFDDGPSWEMCWKIDISHVIPHHINDSIWLAHGTLLIGAGHHIFLHGQAKQSSEKSSEKDTSLNLFEYVARHNGPLDDFHPQMLLQCLLWGKIELVKEIIVLLARHLDPGSEFHCWPGIPIDRFLRTDASHLGEQRSAKNRSPYTSFFADREIEEEEDERFSRTLVETLLDRLETEPLPHLTPNEHAHLLVLIQTTLEIEEQRRALDPNGLRYLISMRSFYILNRRSSSPGSPASNGSVARKTGRRERLRYRDMIWAFHSESQDLMLSSSVAACGGKMRWSDARALGVFLWLQSRELMRSHMELLARNEYMAEDKRDPTDCSLYYFALGKVKLVHGLWRQAAWHKEQAVMLKFLSNDFSEPRWRTAALKNAYALLSKQRFEYAAAFFLLGDSLKDAVNVCLNKLSDFQLAVALARVVEGNDEGPVLQSILKTTVIPLAFKDGNRWLASWAFWLLHRRDLAVRILVVPLQDIAAVLDIATTEIGEAHYDDPSLALLFSQLKMKTLQAAKGTSEISGRTEFNFVLQIARVFCRMGCHALALDLVRSWSFARPTAPRMSPTVCTVNLVSHPSPVSSRSPHFGMDPIARRQSSILIDMEVTAEPPTRRPSPEPRLAKERIDHYEEMMKDDGDLFARKAGMGNLIKSAKQNVQVPEFDMNAFF